MSKDPIYELDDLPVSVAGNSATPSQARSISASDEQATLGKLRTRAVQGSRDLQLEFTADAAYGTASEQDFSNLVKFTVRLKHKK